MHVDGSARACSSMRTVRPMESGYAANAPQKASASHARSSPNAETTPSNMVSYTGFGAVALHATGPWRGADVRDQKAIKVKVALTGPPPPRLCGCDVVGRGQLVADGLHRVEKGLQFLI